MRHRVDLAPVGTPAPVETPAPVGTSAPVGTPFPVGTPSSDGERPAKEAPWTRAAPSGLLLWRRDFRVRCRALEPGEAEALRRAARGTDFAGICEALFDAPHLDEAARRVVAPLGRWLADGLVAAVDVPEPLTLEKE